MSQGINPEFCGILSTWDPNYSRLAEEEPDMSAKNNQNCKDGKDCKDNKNASRQDSQNKSEKDCK